jgi:6-pyruvoyltetrahydropterin/6-carboxytetrahydropterin synthase
MNLRLTTLELYREDLKFSAGHFTIFSECHREKLHGHNYQVYAAITTIIAENGIRFDYRYYNGKLKKLCEQLNLFFLLPAYSPYLKIVEEGGYYQAHFNSEILLFLKSDVLILPIANTTVEDLSNWFLEQLTHDQEDLQKNAIQAITIKVSSNPGRSGSASWTNEAHKK